MRRLWDQEAEQLAQGASLGEWLEGKQGLQFSMVTTSVPDPAQDHYPA